MLILLSDIDGYYTKDPRVYSDATMRKIVNSIDKSELEATDTPNHSFATGGIVTKLKAGDFLLKRDKEMFMASGFDLKDIRSYLLNNIQLGGTLFRN
jgi:glutamate 5-kinase